MIRTWKQIPLFIVILFTLSFAFSSLFAGEADVLKVSVERKQGRIFTFHVTVRHNDTGWKHYANKWDVVGPDGTIYATRVLYHPHETEQPFTRSLSGVKIPQGVKIVTVRAHDLVHGYGGKTVQVKIR